MITFNALLCDLAKDVGVGEAELISTQELVVDGHAVGLYLNVDNDALDAGRVPVASLGPLSEDSLNQEPLSEESTYVVFFTLLGEIDPERQPTMLPTLLQANNLWAGTAGCTLGMQVSSRQITLCGQLPLTFLTGPDLAEVLANFAETATFWRSFVEGTTLPDDGPLGEPLFNLA